MDHRYLRIMHALNPTPLTKLQEAPEMRGKFVWEKEQEDKEAAKAKEKEAAQVKSIAREGGQPVAATKVYIYICVCIYTYI